MDQALESTIIGTEHWTQKGDVRLFLWRKGAGGQRGTILFVHGSSMASQPTFDLQVPGIHDASAMDVFARQGYECWCVDMEGYGRSSKHRDITCDIANGADDLEAASSHILSHNGGRKLLVYGISSGALRAALFAARHPERVARLVLDAFVWTGEGSPTLAERKKKLPGYIAGGLRRPIDRAFVRSIFTRDHPGTGDERLVEAFADAILALDDSVPIGTYIDMCNHLPVLQPEQISCPTLILRGEYDGIASLGDLLAFFAKLPHPDRQFAVMQGISHASLQQKNRQIMLHLLANFFAQPAPIYLGSAPQA